MTSIKLFRDLLNWTEKTEGQQRYLDALEREVERLENLIEDLLTLSRLERDHASLSLQPLDVNRTVALLVDDRRFLAEKQGVAVCAEMSPDALPVLADSALLGQAFSIILTNALNYTPRGGAIEVRTWQTGDRACIAIIDTGPGIPVDEQERIFDRFYRGKAARESKAAGTGLGLTIAREIVARHRGEIAAESAASEGRGATFTIRLPLAPAGEE